MITAYLVRHGQSTWNQAGRIQGKQDPPLSAVGHRQAAALANALRRLPLDAIYSSPQQRARATAETIAQVHSLPVRIAEGLAEIDHGEWEGLTETEVEQQFPASFSMWLTRPSQTQMPGGEHCLSLERRVLDTWHYIVTRHNDNCIAVVSHDIPIKVIIATVLGLSLDHIARLVVDNGSINIIQAQAGRLKLLRLNDRCHLR